MTTTSYWGNWALDGKGTGLAWTKSPAGQEGSGCHLAQTSLLLWQPLSDLMSLSPDFQGSSLRPPSSCSSMLVKLVVSTVNNTSLSVVINCLKWSVQSKHEPRPPLCPFYPPVTWSTPSRPVDVQLQYKDIFLYILLYVFQIFSYQSICRYTYSIVWLYIV